MLCRAEDSLFLHTSRFISLLTLQHLAKEDEGNPEKSDDETEKKAGNEDGEEEVDAEEYEEEDIEEVGLQNDEIKFLLSNFLHAVKSGRCMGCGVNVLRNVPFVSLKENDYIESYFDNGEDFAADSDDNMDGEATY